MEWMENSIWGSKRDVYGRLITLWNEGYYLEFSRLRIAPISSGPMMSVDCPNRALT
jgi:hypothetical protein